MAAETRDGQEDIASGGLVRDGTAGERAKDDNLRHGVHLRRRGGGCVLCATTQPQHGARDGEEDGQSVEKGPSRFKLAFFVDAAALERLEELLDDPPGP